MRLLDSIFKYRSAMTQKKISSDSDQNNPSNSCDEYGSKYGFYAYFSHFLNLHEVKYIKGHTILHITGFA